MASTFDNDFDCTVRARLGGLEGLDSLLKAEAMGHQWLHVNPAGSYHTNGLKKRHCLLFRIFFGQVGYYLGITVGVSEDAPDVDLPDGGVHDGQLQLGGAKADEDEDTAGLAGEDAAP